MTLRLTVDTAAWRRHVDHVVATTPGLVPVVKGNGYGLGRVELAELARRFTDIVAVGTVHELVGLPAGLQAVVLTPSLAPPPLDAGIGDVVLTVGSTHHVEALSGWSGRVLVKVASSMQRYGAAAGADAESLTAAAQAAGFEVVGYSIHPPLAGTDDHHRDEIERLVSTLDPSRDVWVSHLGPQAYAALPGTHRYRLRLGTALWHGDRSPFALSADVVDTRRVEAGSTAGYRLAEVPGPGWLVMIGAGSAHGVAPLADGRSPFHHRRRRLALIETPHMHTSMAFVPDGVRVPEVGELVDVQRPLITTNVDVVEWR